MISAGEIDCRIHIYYQSEKHTQPIEAILANTVRRYGAALLAVNVLVSGSLAVLGIPPAGNEPPNVNYPPPCPLETRLRIYRDFNAYMKSFCNLYHIQYLDVYSVAADEKGAFKDGYSEELPPSPPVHVNRNLMQPIVLELLKA